MKKSVMGNKTDVILELSDLPSGLDFITHIQYLN